MNLYELSADLVVLRDLEEVEASEIIAIEADVDAVKNEIDRLTKIKRAKENHIKRLREYTKSCMEQMNMKKIETPVGNITVRKGTSTLRINDETKLPDKYLEIVQTYKVNKDLLKADLKAGIEIDGAYMTEPGTALMIK